MIFALMMMLTASVSANAMSYEQARNEALFLTDKMAYELNLTDEQYEAAYEINLDYLMGVTSRDDVFGLYWERRNLDLSISCSTGNGTPTWQPLISIVHCIGMLATGTSASMPATRTAATYTSDVLTSIPPIMEVTPGTGWAVADTITATATTSVATAESTSACTTA